METIEFNQIRTEGFLMSWIFTLFSRAFNIQIIRAVWDIIFVFGEFSIIQTGISIFNLIREELTMKNLNFGFNMIRRKTNRVMLDNLAKNLMKKFIRNEQFNKMMVNLLLCMDDEDQTIEVLDKYFDYQATAFRSFKRIKSAVSNSRINVDAFLRRKKTKRVIVEDEESSDESDDEILWD